MIDPAGLASWLDPLASRDQGQDEPEHAQATRILDLVRRLAARQAPVLPAFEQPGSASVVAMSIGADVAQQLAPRRPETLVVVEIAAAVLAAPWLSGQHDQESALVRGLRVADRLLPRDDLDMGRDTGTWGAIAGAMGIAADRARDGIATVACSAASLALTPVTSSHLDVSYCALRVGHASASALLAVSLADAGFVADPQAIDELHDRLGVVPAAAQEERADRIARVAVRAMEVTVR